MLLEAGDMLALGDFLGKQRSSDIAEVVELLEEDERKAVFEILDTHTAAEVLEKVSEATRAELFALLEDELVKLVSELDPDDAADVLGELPERESRAILSSLAAAQAVKVRNLMQYSEDSAGGIMDPVLVSVDEDATVAETVSRIRASEIDEDFYSVFVVDPRGRFVGDVRIRFLLTSAEHTKIRDLLNRDAIYVYADADQEEVRNIFRKNDLMVVPVLDRQRRLVGRITADRVIEVAEEEAAEDIYAMAGTEAAELERGSVLHAARVRMTWLLPCLVGTTVTAFVLLIFKERFSVMNLAIYGTVVAFAPMIAAISGNAGLQTSAIVVSGLAAGHLAALRLGQVFTREARIALVVAVSCGLIGGAVCAVLPGILPEGTYGEALSQYTASVSEQFRIALAFSVAMFSAVMVATTLGLSLPFLFRRVGIDPAISAGPLVTTANDSISVTIYMALALALI